MNIWQFQHRLSQRLMQWGAFSVFVGLVMLLGNKFWRGMGWQFIGWGVVDALIALFGGVAMRERIDKHDNPAEPHILKEEADNLERLLWINAFLDVLYVLGGRSWARGDKGDGSRRGAGLGIVLQGLFLFVFDVLHALDVPKDDKK
jgi:hypothetical protein